jgi:hypothetical protein
MRKIYYLLLGQIYTANQPIDSAFERFFSRSILPTSFVANAMVFGDVWASFGHGGLPIALPLRKLHA